MYIYICLKLYEFISEEVKKEENSTEVQGMSSNIADSNGRGTGCENLEDFADNGISDEDLLKLTEPHNIFSSDKVRLATSAPKKGSSQTSIKNFFNKARMSVLKPGKSQEEMELDKIEKQRDCGITVDTSLQNVSMDSMASNVSTRSCSSTASTRSAYVRLDKMEVLQIKEEGFSKNIAKPQIGHFYLVKSGTQYNVCQVEEEKVDNNKYEYWVILHKSLGLVHDMPAYAIPTDEKIQDKKRHWWIDIKDFVMDIGSPNKTKSRSSKRKYYTFAALPKGMYNTT